MRRLDIIESGSASGELLDHELLGDEDGSDEPAPGALVLAKRIAADRHPAAVYLGRLAPGSRRTMSGALNTVAHFLTGGRCDMAALDWSALRYQHTAAVRSYLASEFAPATANKMLAALRGVLREAWMLGQLPAEDYHRAVALQPMRGASLDRGRALSATELRRLLDACSHDPSPAGTRDAAILAVLYGCGLRRSEVAALDVADYEPDTGAVRVRSGKGRKDRLTYLPTAGQRAIQAWLELRAGHVGAGGPLFTPVNKAGKLVPRRMTHWSLVYILQKRAQQAGVPAFSPHDLRRTMIGDLLDAGADISTVQRLAGHANVTTTARYDRRGEAAKKRAAHLLEFPLSPDRPEGSDGSGPDSDE